MIIDNHIALKVIRYGKENPFFALCIEEKCHFNIFMKIKLIVTKHTMKASQFAIKNEELVVLPGKK